MTVIVEVAATRRISRVEMMLPAGSSGTIFGTVEVLLQESGTPPPPIMKGVRPAMAPRIAGEEVKTYGTLSAAPVLRDFTAVAGETVEVNNTVISFETVVLALGQFFERWIVEDEEKQNAPVVDPLSAPPLPSPGIPSPPPDTEGLRALSGKPE